MNTGGEALFRRSTVKSLFRTAAYLLVLEVIGFGVLLQTYSATAEEAALRTKPEQVRALIEVQHKVELVVLVIGGVLLLLITVQGCRSLAEALRPLVVSEKGVTLPGGREIPFADVSALVFRTEQGGEDLVLMDGLMVPAEDAPDSSIERVFFFPREVEPATVEDWGADPPPGVEIIEDFHLFESAEICAVEIARRYSAACPDGKILSLLNKFRKQRVLFVPARPQSSAGSSGTD